MKHDDCILCIPDTRERLLFLRLFSHPLGPISLGNLVVGCEDNGDDHVEQNEGNNHNEGPEEDKSLNRAHSHHYGEAR